MNSQAQQMAQSLFDAIAHGDEAHKGWLRTKALEWANSYLTERDCFIADIAALHTTEEGVVDHVQAYCLNKLIRRARALEGKS